MHGQSGAFFWHLRVGMEMVGIQYRGGPKEKLAKQMTLYEKCDTGRLANDALQDTASHRSRGVRSHSVSSEKSVPMCVIISAMQQH